IAVASLKRPPRVPRSIIPPAAVHENAWRALSAAELPPTTWPLSLIARANVAGAPNAGLAAARLLRSDIPPAAVHKNASKSNWLSELAPLEPTTWPLALMAVAEAKVPPRVPRSTIPPVTVHENARLEPEEGVQTPTTWPLSLTALALLVAPRVPRSTIPPAAVHKNAA